MKKNNKIQKKQWKTPIIKELNTRLTLSANIEGLDGGGGGHSANISST